MGLPMTRPWMRPRKNHNQGTQREQAQPSLSFLVHVALAITSAKKEPPFAPQEKNARESQKGAKGLSESSVEHNPTNCKCCKKYGGNGLAHAPPKKTPRSECNFNKKYKGWRPRWVCNKIGVDYKEGSDYEQ